MEAGGERNEDWFLQHLVILANRHQITFPVTLQVAGFVVTGHLIGGAQYFESISRSIEQAMPDKSPHWVQFAKSFAKFGEPYSAPPEEQDDGSPEPGPRYLHLKDARLLADSTGNSMLDAKGVMWRGRIDAVSSFVLGIQRPASGPQP